MGRLEQTRLDKTLTKLKQAVQTHSVPDHAIVPIAPNLCQQRRCPRAPKMRPACGAAAVTRSAHGWPRMHARPGGPATTFSHGRAPLVRPSSVLLLAVPRSSRLGAFQHPNLCRSSSTTCMHIGARTLIAPQTVQASCFLSPFTRNSSAPCPERLPPSPSVLVDSVVPLTACCRP